ncbi:MAG: hypothetical protein AAF701_05660 [Pseudomonadota bacterium]
MSPMDIVFHAGMHKTASTHLQQRLQRRLPALEQAGLRFYGPQYFRNEMTGVPATLGIGQSDMHHTLEQRVGPGRRMIISEENYLGLLVASSGRLMHDGLYPNAADRIDGLARAVAPHRFHLALGLRNPATLYVSAYCQALFKGHYRPWDNFTKDVQWDQLNWSKVILPMADRGGCASITLWRYEDYHDVFDQIIQCLLGTPHPDIPADLSERTHEGLSAAAVAACADWHTENHRGPLGILAREDFPVSEDYPKYNPWDATALAALTDQYNKDIAKLRTHPGVTFLAG